MYDEAYFRRWYHDPALRVITPEAVARKVRLVVGIAESLLERPIRSVLDVGCGEGAWRAHLRRLRPAVRYTGVESSAYAVRRFGRRRGIRHGTFGTLDEVRLAGAYDLIVVCDVLQYVPEGELATGLRAIAARLGGVTYLEAYATEDAIEGTAARGTIGARSSIGASSAARGSPRWGCTVTWDPPSWTVPSRSSAGIPEGMARSERRPPLTA